MVRPILSIRIAAPLLVGCVSVDLEDYMDDEIARAGRGEPFDASRRDCLHAAETIEASQGARAGGEAYETCMNARGWSWP